MRADSPRLRVGRSAPSVPVSKLGIDTSEMPSHAHSAADTPDTADTLSPLRDAEHDRWPPPPLFLRKPRTRASTSTPSGALASLPSAHPGAGSPFAAADSPAPAPRRRSAAVVDGAWTDDPVWPPVRMRTHRTDAVRAPGTWAHASAPAPPALAGLQPPPPLVPSASASSSRGVLPRHSAPHSILEVHAAEARRRADTASAWHEDTTGPPRLSSSTFGAKAPHSPLPSTPSSHAAVSPTRRLPHSPHTSMSPSGDTGALDALSPVAADDVWSADVLAPPMRWPPSKRSVAPPPVHRTGSLQVVTDVEESVHDSPTVRSASATFRSRPGAARTQRSVSAVPWPAPTSPGALAPERRDSDPAAEFARLSVSERAPSPSNTQRSPLALDPEAPAPLAPGIDAQATEYVPYMPFWDAMPISYVSLPAPARAFVIKSFTEVDVEKSLRHGVWTSTEKGNNRLDRAWANSSRVGPIYLFFSVNGSGRFCGVAQMMSGLDYSQNTTIWAERHRWKGLFRVRWLLVKDVPNAHLRHIRLTNTNENKPVTQSRDTQELLPEVSTELLRIFCTYVGYSSLQPPVDAPAPYPVVP